MVTQEQLLYLVQWLAVYVTCFAALGVFLGFYMYKVSLGLWRLFTTTLVYQQWLYKQDERLMRNFYKVHKGAQPESYP